MKMLSRTSWLFVLLLGGSAKAQFACTLSASDENACLGTTADDGNHCVWCALSSVGFCVSEKQAESMESNIPGIQCDRYSDTDDDSTPDDDKTPATDDAAPTPNDDSLPPDYWTCLEKKDSSSCKGEGCTWCDSKGGFGLCLTGPSATMAEESDWFTCEKGQGVTFEDPYDKTCVLAYLEDPTQQGCTATNDEDGHSCLWCSLAGMANLCLSQEQADMASQLGVTCEEQNQHMPKTGQQWLRGGAAEDPYDTSCLMAYLMDPTAKGCTAAVDEDGGACEYCSFQNSINLCLTEEQAEMGEQIGITCEEGKTVKDPYDPSCALAFLEDQSEEACKSAVDSDGNPCEFCTLQGSFSMCLNEEQAEIGEQIGFDCDGNNVAEIVDPYDPSCTIAFLQEQTEESCVNAVDADGNPCEYCTLQESFNFCLNDDQAQMAEQVGMECGSTTTVKEDVAFPSSLWECLENYDEGGCGDNSCTWCTTEVGLGFCVADAVADAMRECTFFDCNYKPLQAVPAETGLETPMDPACLRGMQSEESCSSTVDSAGNTCVWCDGAGVFGLCLSVEGARAAGEYLSCDEPALMA